MQVLGTKLKIKKNALVLNHVPYLNSTWRPFILFCIIYKVLLWRLQALKTHNDII